MNDIIGQKWQVGATNGRAGQNWPIDAKIGVLPDVADGCRKWPVSLYGVHGTVTLPPPGVKNSYRIDCTIWTVLRVQIRMHICPANN